MNILITGANRGLGLSLIKVGLEQGYKMFAGVRSMSESNYEYLSELQKMYPNTLALIELDVTAEQSVSKAVQMVKEKSSTLDVIINNAGILNARESIIEDLEVTACKQAFDLNTLGPLRVIKHFLPLIRKGTNQSIINISSDAASLTNASKNDYPYGLSKAALNMLTEKLRIYLENETIQVLAIHPGWMKTDMGGEAAPLNPVDSATNIFKIITRKQPIESPHGFIDHQGISMDL